MDTGTPPRPRRRIVVGLAVLAIAVTGLAVSLATRHDDDPFAAFHQARPEPIPGTFGYELVPAAGTPSVAPDAVYRHLLGADQNLDVALTYADVRNEGDGVNWGPAWVYLSRDLCYFSAKGDFVSPSRAGKTDGCTKDNILVQVVDAQSGDLIATFDAFDVNGGWLPARTGDPQSTPTTRFH
jgi:hypothetical protein